MICICISSGKSKLKQQWDTTTHLLEWPKSGILTTQNADKNVEQQKLSFIAGGNAKWYSHSERQLGNFLQTEHVLTIHSNNHAPCYLPKKSESFKVISLKLIKINRKKNKNKIKNKKVKACVHTKTCAQICIAALFIIAKTWEQPWCRWMNKWTIVYPGNGILFRVKKKWAVKPWKDMVETSMCITKWKKSIWNWIIPNI